MRHIIKVKACPITLNIVETRKFHSEIYTDLINNKRCQVYTPLVEFANLLLYIIL